ncbi:unnamed protein product [Adineta steineri]|uniref:Uncharacterized protein n=1 Tax=Adineta steineri TaxID=433720 RepID=A0A814YEA7_9BILA|nr:unnamed protein product [Adineta steineri]CAF1362017.1 unnamed protein product [Adineta steineri]
MTHTETITMKKKVISTAELKQLVCSGGDERLLLDPLTGVNMYGCPPGPVEPSTWVHLSSSTATPISNGGFSHLAEIMTTLDETDGSDPVDERLEAIRQELFNYIGITSVDADIVFVPSGTDATLQAVFLARICLPRATTILRNLVLAADEAAGRVFNAASGFHFNAKNIRGDDVIKGTPIPGLHGPTGDKTIECIDVSFEKCQDEAYIEESVDRLVNHSGDTHVLLHALDTSKLGNRTPSHDCLNRIEQKYSKEALTILIDACQFRMSPWRIRDHIKRGRYITITGSKFFTGPAFSGAIIVPACFRAQIQQAPVNNYMTNELAAYSAISDWPQSWTNIRSCLNTYTTVLWKSNIGQFLRITAAMFELRRYSAIPSSWREQFIVAATAEIRAAFSSVPDLLEPLENKTRNSFFDEFDEEFRHLTIFPFFIRQPNKVKTFLNLDACKELYQKLQIPNETNPITVVIGQPAAIVVNGYPDTVTTFRFSIDARTISDAFERAHGAVPVKTDILQSRLRLIIKKIADIVNTNDNQS